MVFQEVVGTTRDQTDKLVRESVRAIPDGVHECSSFLDDDGKDFTKTLLIKFESVVQDDQLDHRLLRSGDQAPGLSIAVPREEWPRRAWRSRR